MKITIDRYFYKFSPAVARALLQRAKFRINMYSIGTNEILLNRYLKNKYNLDLKSACKKILDSVKVIYEPDDNELIVVFQNKEDDDLASLITYGSGSTPGSKIIKFMFKQPLGKD